MALFGVALARLIPSVTRVISHWNSIRFNAPALAAVYQQLVEAEQAATPSGEAAKLAPPTGLRGVIPYIRRARLFVSGDTGPMHLASAFGVPVVGIFGPTDPAKNGPFGAGDEVVWEDVPCGPCYKHRCPGYGNVCMTSIEVDDVLEAVRRRLHT